MKTIEGGNFEMLDTPDKNTTIATVSIILLVVFVGILIQVYWL